MLSRRQLLALVAESAACLALPGCAASPPLKKNVFPEFGDAQRPYLGLATSLKEEYSYEARVEGAVPAELRGTLYRNGPGLFDRDDMRKRNILDGDGMVQSFRFHDGGVHYRNRFVRTKKFTDEAAAGRFIYPSWSTQAPGGFWHNFLRVGLIGQAGITVFPWRGRLYAFDECALPYELDRDTLETYGLSTLGLPKDETIYAAHAKFDPATGEWLHFGVLYGPSPKLHVTIFRPDGTLKSHRALNMPRMVYMHDWSVSSRHLIFTLHPVYVDYWPVFLGHSSMLECLTWKGDRGNLIVVLDREGDKAPVMLEQPSCYMWHSINAFDTNGGEIVADFIGYENPDHFVGKDPVASAVMHGRRGENAYPGAIRRYLIDPGRKSIREEMLDPGNYEWPRVNEQHRCYGYRFAYILKATGGEFFWNKVCRIDMRTGRVQTYDFGKGSYLTEPVFVPLPGRLYQPSETEEPGFVLTEVYDSGSRRSYLAILRSDRIADGPLAKVHLTHHVPFSYHGWWSGRT